jgi:eukaryotic-like serine/threonine-protein kinase
MAPERSPESPPASKPAAPLRIGRYLLFEPIASGGMATVHYGRLMGPGGFSRVVAIKRLHAHLTKEPAFVSMLLDEARLAARVRHPNVVPVLDVADLPDELCLVMEYVHGESLAALLRLQRKQTPGLPVPIASALMVGALMGLHAAHEAVSEAGAALGIVHRDVSPQNVIVGRDGLARVLDFGIAFAAERIQVTRDGQIKGKLAYMAPEQVLGEKVDRRTDVYGASVVLWEALTGRKLFAGENTAHTMRLITDGVPTPPSTLVPGIPRELDAAVMKGVARDAKDRFATASEMASAIEQALDIASQQEVSRWVVEIAGEDLAVRSARLASIEQYVDGAEAQTRPGAASQVAAAPVQVPEGSSAITEVATESSMASAPHQAAARRSTVVRAVLACAAASVVLGAVAVGVFSGSPKLSVARASITAPSVQWPEPYSAPSSEPAAPAASTAHPPTTARNTGPVPPPRPKGACNPPWTVDKDGVRVPKKECF